MFIDPRVQEKISLNAEKNPQALIDMFHPTQLEKRFGGSAPTPTNFWPPQMSQEFFPNDDRSHLEFINQDEYPKILKQNPELKTHPEFLNSSS